MITILSPYCKAVDRVLGSPEIWTFKGNLSYNSCLAGTLFYIVGLSLTEISVKCRYQDGSFRSDDINDTVDKDIHIYCVAVLGTGIEQGFDI